MTQIDPNLLEQLSAWMDGELPPDQARFLQRRLDTDPTLRAHWERWQLASACVRGQPVRLMPASLADDIARAVSGAPAGRSRLPWLASAAAAMLVVALLPRMMADDPGLSPAPDAGAMAVSIPRAAVFDTSPALAQSPVSPIEPMPSVRDFPLVEASGSKPWPRSPLVPDDRSMQAYLVRHNALMAEDGLAGFMPYVDVVAHEPDPSKENAARNPDQ